MPLGIDERLPLRHLAWAEHRDDCDQIHHRQQTTRNELAPLSLAWPELTKRRNARDNQNEVRDAGDEHHGCVGAAQLAAVKKVPNLARPRPASGG